MRKFFTSFATKTSTGAGHPFAFMLAVSVILVWAATGPLFHYSDTWQLVINTGTTIVTFVMVFLIQNAQNRDASAIQCKLDELIRAVGHARNQFIGIEHLTDLQLREIREKLEAQAGNEEWHRTAIERLIARR
ncbi:MAG: low affinity iron permease family protein [Sphingomicrobium sp.]